MELFYASQREDHSLFLVGERGLYATLAEDESLIIQDSLGWPALLCAIVDRYLGSKTGEYTIRRGDTFLSFLQKVILGRQITRKITIPEGWTVRMIVEELQNNEILTGSIDVLPEEGSLMPDTYFCKFGDTREKMIRKMQKEMSKAVAKLNVNGKNRTGLSMRETVILASIIEKETSVDDERALVASVFCNRLRLGMRLQSDPTVIYAMSGGIGKIDRKLTKQDLWFQSSYNTYRNRGLPPAPICNPGRKSLEAATNPANTKYLYFVAEASGQRHMFSGSFEMHKKNVNKSHKKQRAAPPDGGITLLP